LPSDYQIGPAAFRGTREKLDENLTKTPDFRVLYVHLARVGGVDDELPFCYFWCVRSFSSSRAVTHY
jgi:hypothetical protein